MSSNLIGPTNNVFKRSVNRAFNFAGMAELVDALDSGSSGESHAGSSPVTRTILEQLC